MKEYFKIAWRNLWRNKRRTAITSASILFAVFFALIMRSFQLGFYDHMISNAIESFSGFIQVQHIDYQDDPSLENTFPLTPDLLSMLESMEETKAVVPRIETFALASSGLQTKGALVLGIDPEKEKSLSNPEERLVRYHFSESSIKQLKSNLDLSQEVKDKIEGLKSKSYTSEGSILLDLDMKEKDAKEILPIIKDATQFKGQTLVKGDAGVLISDRLAKFLKISVADTLILLGQGYQGATAAGVYPIRGIVKFPNPDLDNKLVYMTLANAQYFSNLSNNVTSIAINLHNNSEKNMNSIQELLQSKIDDPNLAVKNWEEFNVVLKQQIEGDNQSGKAMLGLLYFIIFFGIIGTVLMMIHERQREMGVLIAVGMQRTKLAVILIIEMVFIGLIGVSIGTILSLPILWILHNNPIHLTGEMAQLMEDFGFEAVMPLAWIDTYVLWQGLVVALMVALSCIFPLRKVIRLKPVNALRA